MRAASLPTALPGGDVGEAIVAPLEAPSAAAREDVAMEAPTGSSASCGAGISLTQSLPLLCRLALGETTRRPSPHLLRRLLVAARVRVVMEAPAGSGQPVLDKADLLMTCQPGRGQTSCRVLGYVGVLSVATRGSHEPPVATGGLCARAAPASGQAHVGRCVCWSFLVRSGMVACFYSSGARLPTGLAARRRGPARSRGDMQSLGPRFGGRTRRSGCQGQH